MRIFSLTLLLVVLGVSHVPAQGARARVMIVMDCSGSMAEALDGRSRIDLARTALAGLLPGLDAAGAQVGLLAFGHRDRTSCGDIEVMMAPADGASATIVKRLSGVRPRGRTPLAAAIERAGMLLLTAGDVPLRMIVLTDGLETCGGDPVAKASALRSRGVDMKVHVVGLGTTSEEGSALAEIARAGNGEYFHARDAKELTRSFERIRAETTEEITAGSEAVSDFIDEFDRSELGDRWQLLNQDDEMWSLEDGALSIFAGETKRDTVTAAPNTLELARDLPESFSLEIDVSAEMPTLRSANAIVDKRMLRVDLAQDDHNFVGCYWTVRHPDGMTSRADKGVLQRTKRAGSPMKKIDVSADHWYVAQGHALKGRLLIVKSGRTVTFSFTGVVDGKKKSYALGTLKVRRLDLKRLRIRLASFDPTWPEAELRIERIALKTKNG